MTYLETPKKNDLATVLPVPTAPVNGTAIKRKPQPPAYVMKTENGSDASLTFRGYLILISLSYMVLSSGAAYSLMAPFYPREAEEKGLTATQYGMVFAVYQVVAFLFCPISGIIAMYMTPKVFMQTSCIVSCYCSCLFGILNWAAPGESFFILSMMIRIFWAVGGAGVTCAGYLLGTLIFPKHVSQVYATLEMCFGLGMIVGPGLGGFFYTWGGFFCPFFLTSVLGLLGVIPVHFLIQDEIDPNKKTSNTESIGYWQTIRVPGVWVNLLISVSACAAFGYTEATLDHHIREIGDFTPAQSGLVFLVIGLAYSISSQVWGYIARKKDNVFHLIIFGMWLCAISILLVGPCPGIPLPSNIYTVVFSQIVFGLSMGCIFVLSFDDVIKEAKGRISNSDKTIAMISGLYSASYALGNSIGPAVGGYMLENFGYVISTIPIAAQMLFISGITICYICMRSPLESENKNIPC